MTKNQILEITQFQHKLQNQWDIFPIRFWRFTMNLQNHLGSCTKTENK